MDEEGLCAVAFLDVAVRDAGLKVEHGVGIEAESFEDAVDFEVLDITISFALTESMRSLYFVKLFGLFVELCKQVGVVFGLFGAQVVEFGRHDWVALLCLLRLVD